MSAERQAPTFDAAREDRLRGLQFEFAIGIPSGKVFDLDQMQLLGDDLTAMLGEIDSLRAAARSAREDSARLRALVDGCRMSITLYPPGRINGRGYMAYHDAAGGEGATPELALAALAEELAASPGSRDTETPNDE